MQKWATFMKFPTTELLKTQLESFFTKNNWLALRSTKKYQSPKSRIDIRHIIPQDIPNIFKLFDKKFDECEPLVKSLQLPNFNYNYELKDFIKNSIKRGTTFIADLKNYENLIGAVINTKITPWEPEWCQLTKNIKCNKTKDFINIWGFVIKDSKLLKKYRNGNIFNINHVIVDEELCKKNYMNKYDLSTMLIDKSFRMAPLVDCKLASIICTDNNIMHQIAKNLNMNLIYDNPCSNLINDNYQPILNNLIETDINVKIFTKQFA